MLELRPSISFTNKRVPLLLKNIMNQSGDTTLEIPITMDQLLTSLMERLVHTKSLRMMFNSMDLMSTSGDTIAEIPTIMDHSPTSPIVRLVHTR